jgi:hypothetical protein
MKKVFLFAITATVLFSCKKDDEKAGFFKGNEVAVHDGKAWSWVKLNKEGAPEQLSLTLNDDVLNSVPVGDETGGGHSHENSVVVPLPEQAVANTPFKYIGLDWNPYGHDPANVYTLPHFDLHFYMVPKTEVEAAVDMAKMDVHPAADYLPQAYVPGPPVPQMGKHWVDITSPELSQTNPQTFTQTFIYGTYNGRVTFYEPMITLNFLKTTPTFQRSIPQPAKVQQTGYYPTQMRIQKHGSVTEVILDNFIYRQAS